MALGRLLLVIYYFTAEDSQRRIAIYLGLNPNLVSSICRRLQDVCSRDLQNRPITPFGGPGTVSKCDESKFNHKPKVRPCNYTINSRMCLVMLQTLKKKMRRNEKFFCSETPRCFILRSLCITVHRKKLTVRVYCISHILSTNFIVITPLRKRRKEKNEKDDVSFVYNFTMSLHSMSSMLPPLQSALS